MRYSETYLPCQWQNKNENKLDQEMILVDNLDPSTEGKNFSELFWGDNIA